VVKKIFTWLFVAFLFFFVAYSPDSAARIARAIGGLLISVANGFTRFLSGLT
jgi:hypothetical protein